MENAAAQPVAVTDDLQQQLDALKAKNAELINERRKDKENREKLQQQLSDIESAKEKSRRSTSCRIRRVQNPLGRRPDRQSLL